MTVSYFTALESQIPAVEARAMMAAAQAALYPHVTKEGAERMWQAWVRQAEPPRPLSAMPAPGALFSLNGKPVNLHELRFGLGQAMGAGLSA